MLQRLIDAVNFLVCWFQKSQRIKTTNAIVKVNIGPGLSVAPGWINIDVSLNVFFYKWPTFLSKIIYSISGARRYKLFADYKRILKNNTFIHHDIKYGIPFADGNVDYIYTSYFLNCLFRAEAQELLREFYRVLKEGGLIRISISDLEYVINLYQKGEKRHALSFFFADSELGYFHVVRYMYDFGMLENFLKDAGFINIRRCSFRDGMCPDIAILDNRPGEALFIEALKSHTSYHNK